MWVWVRPEWFGFQFVSSLEQWFPCHCSRFLSNTVSRKRRRALLNNPIFANLAGFFLNAYWELVLRTSRISLLVNPEVDRLVKEQRLPVIYALWHCHVFFMPLLRRYERRAISVLLSSHRDARYVGLAARLRGVQLVEGSSTRGGMQAYRQLYRCINQGQSVVITPDGPKGPSRQIKPGVIKLASQTANAVVPVVLDAKPSHRINSWDRTVLPLPFGRHTLIIGAPLYFNRFDECSQQCIKLAVALDRLASSPCQDFSLETL
ncbi:MAG: DUF374 domain-containing protein [Cyanobacteria bacterium K_DeepCast_0m_m1_088]|nr:DUF374 domain-containing protein [Cyanobacteria bacterium K_DeepCast_0m_m1_088]